MSELTEMEILDYLMTSEFNEGLTPDEFKFLLFKFRNFYRIATGNVDNIKSELERSRTEVMSMRPPYSEHIQNLQSQKDLIESDLLKLRNRKLSWKERFKGKII